MILSEAYELMDLLLDKADQPYFTNEEKDKFLDLAISDFVTFHYQRMTSDEESRRAMAPLIDWHSWNLSNSDILSGNYIYSNAYPAFSIKYPDTTASKSIGHWEFGNQYVLPREHLYVLSMSAKYYNREKVLDGGGVPYSGVTSSDIKKTAYIPVKNKSIRDYYEDNYNADPFNKTHNRHRNGHLDISDGLNPHWSYLENRIVLAPSSNLSDLHMQVITLPERDRAFSSFTYGATTSPSTRVFTDHYQKQIVNLAVKKMTQVDVGLMTPPSQ
jgi:hypothetical protein